MQVAYSKSAVRMFMGGVGAQAEPISLSRKRGVEKLVAVQRRDLSG